MIISHSRRFVFVHIHKAGGTSIEKALDPHLAWNDLIIGGSQYGEAIQAAYRKKFHLSKHSTVAEIEAVCGARYFDEYFAFALVRHPLARACSVYNFVATTINNWAVREGIPFEEIHQHVTPEAIKKRPGLGWASTRIFLETAGFSEFIRHTDIGQVPGFRTQVGILRRKDSDRLAGNVFKLEDHSHWVGELGARLGIELRLPHANKSGVRLTDPEEVSGDDKSFVESLFAEDYKAFGYSSSPVAS